MTKIIVKDKYGTYQYEYPKEYFKEKMRVFRQKQKLKIIQEKRKNLKII